MSNTEKRKLRHSTWFPQNGKLDSHVQSQILYMGTVHAANNAYMIYKEGLWGCGGTVVVEGLRLWRTTFDNRTRNKVIQTNMNVTR
jgi:hypothetical protein